MPLYSFVRRWCGERHIIGLSLISMTVLVLLFNLTLVAGSGFKRHQGSGDLIFLQYTSGTNCVDPTTGIADLAQVADITGGTGRFANATGSFEETSEGTILLADPALRAFIYFPYQINGTITLAEGGNEGVCSLNVLGLPCP